MNDSHSPWTSSRGPVKGWGGPVHRVRSAFSRSVSWSHRFSPLLEASGTSALDHKLALKMGVTMLITTLPVASASSVLPKTTARLPVPRAVGLPPA
jgi:hypothetical protein